ncbi:hypothetical protein C2U72_25430 [Prosthecomicrobium hirschii]|uniref:hypothetical protein n=1 Tax=Prosthecodimorpha hirschii TaxID=665126 RepID=UPI00112657B0|nr:hypothetical protein [Prosthecomicrobium hirschii]TPQ46630.1 hypothetical protein C2U72_25430 [Prosthecomicrobium hirschii]
MLKLVLVPATLLVVSWVGIRFGPRASGWLAGLPVMAGPILFLLALERGPAFGAASATASLPALAGTVAFNTVYSRLALAGRGPVTALTGAVVVWVAIAFLVSGLPHFVPLGLAIALGALFLGPHAIPKPDVPLSVPPLTAGALAFRMIAGAALTVAVTGIAAPLGPAWSGPMTLFPVVSAILGVSSHLWQGGAVAAVLLRALIIGMVSLAAFLAAAALLLEPLGLAWGFLAAIAAALAAQAATWYAGAGRPAARNDGRSVS